MKQNGENCATFVKIAYFLKYKELQTGRHHPKSNVGTSEPLKRTNVHIFFVKTKYPRGFEVTFTTH